MKISDILLAMFVTLIWGSAFAIIEIGLQGFPPILNASLRFLTASIPWVFFIKKPNVSWRFLFLFGMNYVLMFSLMYVGMKIGMPSGLTSLVLQSAVIFALILSIVVLKEKPHIMQLIGVFIGFIGIVIIATDKQSVSSIFAFILVIGAAFFYGASSIIIKQAGNVEMLPLLVWGCLIPPLPLFGLSLMLEQGQWQAIVDITAVGIGSVYYTSLLGTVVAFAIWGALLKRYPANMVVPFNLLVPVFGLLTSYILLGQQINAKAGFACGLILLSLLLISFHHIIRKFFNKKLLSLRSQS